MQEALKKEMECPICTEEYVEPKSLNCGHSLCLECLKKIYKDGTVDCPICRHITIPNFPDVNSLSTNFVLNSMMVHLKAYFSSMESLPSNLIPEASIHATAIWDFDGGEGELSF